MSKKILIGICDIGMGHLNRQKCIINELIKYDVDILLTCTDKNEKLLEKIFPNISRVKINIPWISCDSNGIDFSKCLEIYNNNKIDYYADFMNFCINVEKYFDGIPDYVFTDYECNVAKYAYARDVHLIGMEQHSKFLFLKDENLELNRKYGIKEETSRLKFFFPKVDYRIISSFFPINNIPDALLLPPIVENIKCNSQNEDFILTYFSPYVSDKAFFNDIYNMMKNDSNNYILYTKFDFEKSNNIILKSFSDDFKKDLLKCKCVISTSGHQLISESIHLEKPLYLLPIDTFEQHYSNLMVKKYKLGMDINDSYQLFLNSIEKIKLNMIKYKQEYWQETWDVVLNDYFSKSLGLERGVNDEIPKTFRR